MSHAPVTWWLDNVLAIVTYLAILILIVQMLPKRYTVRQLLIVVRVVSLLLGVIAWVVHE